MWTAEARKRATEISHRIRKVKCSWPGCKVILETRKSGINYCDEHRAARMEERSREKAERLRKENSRRGRKYDQKNCYRIIFDPDGDFTGAVFDRTNIQAMLSHKSLGPGAVIATPDGGEIRL